MSAIELLKELENKIPIDKLSYYAKLLNRQYNLYLTEKQLWDLPYKILDNTCHYIIGKYTNDLKIILKKREAQFIPVAKQERTELILKQYDNSQINKLFKEVIKYKYHDKWHFLKRHFEDIYPIDIQAFFHSQIDPKLAYYTSGNCSNKVYI